MPLRIQQASARKTAVGSGTVYGRLRHRRVHLALRGGFRTSQLKQQLVLRRRAEPNHNHRRARIHVRSTHQRNHRRRATPARAEVLQKCNRTRHPKPSLGTVRTTADEHNHNVVQKQGGCGGGVRRRRRREQGDGDAVRVQRPVLLRRRQPPLVRQERRRRRGRGATHPAASSTSRAAFHRNVLCGEPRARRAHAKQGKRAGQPRRGC
mmetsp:Transcript_4726/g.11650  ORF Transcript_4726/g.11650 Transcript_4726/m.11650 type:complete len:208 (+) Transcript_4726:412-1035(+)